MKVFLQMINMVAFAGIHFYFLTDIIMTSNTAFFDELLKFEIKSWADLVSAAKFLRVMYAGYVSEAAQAIPRMLKSETGNQLKFYSALANIEFFGRTQLEANHVYLGARSAVLENKPGDFGNTAIGVRARDALCAGVLIENFLEAARAMVATNVLFLGDRSHPKILQTQDKVAHNLHTRADGIIQLYGKRLNALRPQPETLVNIITDEIGVFPEAARKTILDSYTGNRLLEKLKF